MRVRAAAVLLLITVAGCGEAGDAPDAGETVRSPLADCTGLTEPLAAAEEALTSHEPLPDLTLPCFTGGEPFRLADLRGPAIVNLWASWCTPCREELPLFQRYADRAAGEIRVLGVVHQDPRPEAAALLARDLGITFPALVDQEGQVRTAVGAVGVPATVFVDSEGLIRYVYQGPPLDEPTLAQLVTEHLGVSL
jgi:thiol-disulfide isomerase/thioredoxin